MFELVWTATGQSLYMVAISTILSYALGLPLGIILVTTSKGHIMEARRFNAVLAAIINAGRSIPFIILMVAIIPFTRFLVGRSIGTTASIVPLTVAAIPFVARLVEQSLREVDWGVIEAALAMGASPWQIITKVLLPESISSLILGGAITTITLISYSAMAGVLGGGGLGDLAVRYGFYRYQQDVMLITVALLIILVQVVQSIGDRLAARLRRQG